MSVRSVTPTYPLHNLATARYNKTVSNFKEKITRQLEELRLKKLTPEERAVMTVLWKRWKDGGGRVTQMDIARSEPWLGCHEKYEMDRVRKPDETTLRKVRQIIRDLRVTHYAPILSDRAGYWIPKGENEVREYLDRLEAEAKAQIQSWLETHRSMEVTFGMSCEYLRTQQKLWN